jgi:hypothetical protein
VKDEDTRALKTTLRIGCSAFALILYFAFRCYLLLRQDSSRSRPLPIMLYSRLSSDHVLCSQGCRRAVALPRRCGVDIAHTIRHGEAKRTEHHLFRSIFRMPPDMLVLVHSNVLSPPHFGLLLSADEIDGLTPVRSAKQNQVHASVVTTLLSLMDGLTSSGEVFVLASTNRIDAIDPALRRPGRFDREVYVGLPNQQHRQEIIRIHTATWPVQSQLSDEDCHQVAVATVGFSGADLRALCSEAALLAAHRVIGPTLMNSSDAASAAPRRSADVLARLPNVHVSILDFHSALTRVSSSIRRHDKSFSQQQGAHGTNNSMLRLMQTKLREAKSVLDLPVAIFNDHEVAQTKPAECVPMDDDAAPDLIHDSSLAHLRFRSGAGVTRLRQRRR